MLPFVKTKSYGENFIEDQMILQKREYKSTPRFRLAHILGTSAGYGLAELSGRLVQFAATFYLARQCTVAEFGIFGFLIAVQQIVALLGQAGLVELLTGYVAKAPDFGQRDRKIATVHHFGWWYRVGWFGFSAVFLSLFSIWGYLDIPKLLLVIAAATGLFLSKFYLESATYQIIQLRIKSILFKVIPILVLYGAGTFCFVVGGYKLTPFFLGAFIALVVLTIIISVPFLMEWSSQGYNACENNPADLLIQALPYLVVAILGWLTGYGIILFIKFIFDSEAVAHYTMAFTLTMPIFMLCNVMNQAWNPKFIELANKAWSTDNLNHANAVASSLQLLLVSISATGLILFSPLFFTSIGGNLKAYSAVVPYAGIMMLGYIFLNMYYRVSIYYLISNESKRYMLNSIISGLVGLLITIVLMLSIGQIGIYIGIAVSNALLGLLFFFYARMRWSVQWPVKNLILAATVVLTALLLSQRLSDIISTLIAFSCIIIFSSVVWFCFNKRSLRGVQA